MARIRRTCWCGARSARIIGHPIDEYGDAYRLVRCTGCGVYTLDPQPSPAQLAHAYAGDYYGASKRKFVWPISSLVGWFQEGRARMVARVLNSGASVLDVGCGNGGFLEQMQRRGFRVEGTEWSSDSAARVPPALRDAVHVGDVVDVELPARSYDAITLWHVFEHLAQPSEALEKISTLLAPGGRLFMSMPNHESWQSRRYGTHWFHLDPPRHLFGFGRNSLTALLKHEGFRVEGFHTWSMEQNPYGIIQSQLNAWGFPRNRAYSMLKGRSRAAVYTRLKDAALVAMLTIPALLASITESMRGRGGTMTIVARKIKV